MAYIVMQPRPATPSPGSDTLAPGATDRIDLTADYLAKHIRMPVSTMIDGISLEPNHVYVMPPLRHEPDTRQRVRFA